MYINSVDDFTKIILDINKDLDVHKSDEKIIYISIILIKNYLTANEIIFSIIKLIIKCSYK